MGDRYQKLPTGASVTDFSITVYNDAIDMLQWWKSQYRTGGGPQKNLVDWDQSVFKIDNAAGADLDEYDIVGVDGSLYVPGDNLDSFMQKTPLNGVAPASPDHLQRFGVALEANKSGSGIMVRVLKSGMVPVRLKVVSEYHKYARIDDGATDHLISDCVGYPIEWLDEAENEITTGIRWALVTIGGAANLLGEFELKDDKAPGSSAAAYPLIYDGTADTDADTFDVYDQEGGKQWRALGRDTKTGGGAKGVAKYNLSNGHFEIVQMHEQSRMVCGGLGGPLTATTSNQTISSPVAMDGGQLPTTVTADNVYQSKGFAGPSGGRCVALLNETTAHYEFIDVECN
jgi:hypothetical protein